MARIGENPFFWALKLQCDLDVGICFRIAGAFTLHDRMQPLNPKPSIQPSQLQVSGFEVSMRVQTLAEVYFAYGDFPKLGVLFGCPYYKDHGSWGLYWGPPILGNYHIHAFMRP